MFLTSRFPGQHYLPSNLVKFPTSKGDLVGRVQKLNKNYARVTVADDQTVWKVPYRLMKMQVKRVNPEITLKEIEEFAYDKLDEYGLKGWKFGFDLAQNRGGVCNYTKKQITLSVSYCGVASREKVIDTVLHEIAHALTPGAGHGYLWRKKARELGCDPDPYHDVVHGVNKWRGTCPCGNTWKRKKLMKKVRDATCPNCREKITWRQII